MLAEQQRKLGGSISAILVGFLAVNSLFNSFSNILMLDNISIFIRHVHGSTNITIQKTQYTQYNAV